ncbi:MAG: hypothetical protein ABIH82_00175 [Candidatus Woesearchaeota archaeon]
MTIPVIRSRDQYDAERVLHKLSYSGLSGVEEGRERKLADKLIRGKVIESTKIGHYTLTENVGICKHTDPAFQAALYRTALYPSAVRPQKPHRKGGLILLLDEVPMGFIKFAGYPTFLSARTVINPKNNSYPLVRGVIYAVPLELSKDPRLKERETEWAVREVEELIVDKVRLLDLENPLLRELGLVSPVFKRNIGNQLDQLLEEAHQAYRTKEESKKFTFLN